MKGSDKTEPKKDFNRIIVPVDYFDDSIRAAKKAFSLTRETGLDVTTIFVVNIPGSTFPEFSNTYPQMVDIIKSDGKKTLDKVKNMGTKMGVNVKTKLVVGIPDDEIIKEAGKKDLIIMGCKGRSALSKILIGSVCEKVLHHSSSSIMVIR